MILPEPATLALLALGLAALCAMRRNQARLRLAWRAEVLAEQGLHPVADGQIHPRVEGWLSKQRRSTEGRGAQPD
jgi:hypothetical protein